MCSHIGFSHKEKITALLGATGCCIGKGSILREGEQEGFVGLSLPIPASLQETKVGAHAFPWGWTIFPQKSL